MLTLPLPLLYTILIVELFLAQKGDPSHCAKKEDAFLVEVVEQKKLEKEKNHIHILILAFLNKQNVVQFLKWYMKQC